VTITLARAINAALHDAMAADDRVVMYGEDVGQLGGVFRVTDGLQKAFGESRCFDSPLAEAGIVGTAIGMSLLGVIPVVEMQFDGFSYPALNQVISHVAKYRNRTRGSLTVPLVIRIPYAGGIGAVEHHSESPEVYYAHTAGLKVVTPSTPADAYSLLRRSIEDPDPVVFLEPKQLYWSKEDVELPVDTGSLGTAIVRRVGNAASLIAYGPTVLTAMRAAEAAAEDGVEIEVLDLRSLRPLDVATVVGSVKKTGRAIVIHEDARFCGLGAEVMAELAEQAFEHLEAPLLRITGFDIPYPPAKLERFHIPDVDRVLDGLERVLAY
jgi:pyruvate dehydrogenase E1 component beta subunit